VKWPRELKQTANNTHHNYRAPLYTSPNPLDNSSSSSSNNNNKNERKKETSKKLMMGWKETATLPLHFGVAPHQHSWQLKVYYIAVNAVI